jgi:stage III sporulation protein AE
LKGILCFICLFFLVLPLPSFAFAAASQPAASEPVNEQLTDLDMSGVENFVNQLDSEITEAVPDLKFKDLVKKIASRDVDWKPVDLFTNCMHYIFKEVVANLDLLGKLIVLAIICVVLQNLVSAFEKGTTGQLTYMVTFLVLITIAVGSFGLAVQLGREVVDNMVTFMQALLPVMLTLMVAVGGISSAAILHPVIFVTITGIGTIIKNVILPLIFFAAVLDIVSHLSSRFQVSRLGGLMKTCAMGALGILTTLFLGIMAIQGVAGAVGDSLALRTAKFATDAFIPVVGGVFSEAVEAVVGSSLLLKNAVGIGGLIVICLMMVIPLLKIISLAFIYKLAGALIQPVGDNQLGDCLNSLGSNLLTVFGAVATVGLLFFFAVTIVLVLGNFTVMLR